MANPSPQDLLARAVEEVSTLARATAALGAPLAALARAMAACWEARGKILLAGNGGSAADAIHLAEELSVRFEKNRRALAAIPLTDAAALTCAANDFGYDHVFSRQVEALGNPADLFIGFSTSGKSPSILNAMRAAKARGMLVAGFLGKSGGPAAELCDFPLIIPSNITHRIQEMHQLLYHTLCEWVDAQFPELPPPA